VSRALQHGLGATQHGLTTGARRVSRCQQEATLKEIRAGDLI
jgi:hypothetical protein